MKAMNYGFLKEIVSDRVGGQKILAEKLGISLTSLGNKLNNKVPFTHEEILKSAVILNLNDSEIVRCFFICK